MQRTFHTARAESVASLINTSERIAETTIWNESKLITKKIGKNFSKMKIKTDLKIIIDMFSRLFFAYKRYQKGISKHKKAQSH